MAAFDGRLHVNEIRDVPKEIEGTHADKWVHQILVQSAPDSELTGLSAEQWAEQAQLAVRATITKMGSDYEVQGELKGVVTGVCARCAEHFPAARESNFRVFLHRDTRARGEELGATDDPDYIVFNSDHLEFIDIFAEQLMILEPYAESQAGFEDGGCAKCAGQPLKYSQVGTDDAGQNDAPRASSPFLKLADLKKKL